MATRRVIVIVQRCETDYHQSSFGPLKIGKSRLTIFKDLRFDRFYASTFADSALAVTEMGGTPDTTHICPALHPNLVSKECPKHLNSNEDLINKRSEPSLIDWLKQLSVVKTYTLRKTAIEMILKIAKDLLAEYPNSDPPRGYASAHPFAFEFALPLEMWGNHRIAAEGDSIRFCISIDHHGEAAIDSAEFLPLPK